MTTEEQKEFGRRVAFLRRKLGYSQSEFARKIDRSEAWLSQVERGVRAIDRMSVLERLAEALNVPLSELAPNKAGVVGTAREPGLANPLVLTLASNVPMRAMLAMPAEPVDVTRLEERAEQAWSFAHEARFDELSQLLTKLLPDIEVAERHVAEIDRVQVLRAKARSYLAAAGVLAKLGETGAAWVAIDRAMNAAERLGDPLLMAEGAFRLAVTFQVARRFDLAIRVADSAAQSISTLMQDADADPAAIALHGALHLQLAVANARINDADAAYGHLDIARDAADRIGEGRNDYHTEFGPANVLLHEVAVAVELGDAGRALRVAERAAATHLSAERRGRLMIDVAQANAQLRRFDAVIAALAEGFRIAPHQLATHSRVRELVADLLRSEHSRRPEVRALAKKVQVVG